MKLPHVQQVYPKKLLSLFVLITISVLVCSFLFIDAKTMTRVSALAATSYQNPVIRRDFPDPAVIYANGNYYAYATNSDKNVQIARSPDLINWTLLPDALPKLGSWATAGNTWAPDVMRVGNVYNLYYTAREPGSGKQCVGVATSSSPEGPFSDMSSHPLVCHADEGGDIDASGFSDGGTLYLYFKNDGNCCGVPVHLYVQQLSSDGLSLVGDPRALVTNDQAWEANLVEAPYMFKHNSKYYLFFSANAYYNGSYAEGYATCQSAMGPCQPAAENPILASNTAQRVIGPGGASLLQIGSESWMVYHEYHVNADGSQGNGREMAIDRVDWPNDKPAVAVNGGRGPGDGGGTGSGNGTFASGFESGDVQPGWSNTVDASGQPAGGIANVGGICCGLTGPESGVRNEVTHNGSSALMYSGLASSGGSSDYAYLEVFDLSSQNIVVGSTTTLSYWIYPQSSTASNLVSGSNSSCVAIDLIFQNGSGVQSNLRDAGALDQNGNAAHPASQCGRLTLDSWNHVTINLGSHSSGLKVIRLDVGYDQPGRAGGYRGYIDDVSISN